MNRVYDATANFVPNTLTVSVGAGGRVTGPSLSCPGACAASYTGPTGVTLTATPNADYHFTGWANGGCSGNASTCSFTMAGSRDVSASFDINKFPLTVAADGSGTVAGGGINCPGACSVIVNVHTPITLNAAPAANWLFQGWDGACSGTGACTVAVDAPKSVTAHFKQITDRLTVTKNGNGVVTTTSGQINCGSSCASDFARGSGIVLKAAGNPDTYFSNWTGACSGANPTCALNINGATSVGATFVKPTITLAKAVMQASWRASHLTGNLVVSGTTVGDGALTLTLSGGNLSAPATFPITASGGPFSQTLPLPATLLPGVYGVSLAGTFHGVNVAPASAKVVLPSSPLGVVGGVVFSTSQNGTPVDKIPADAKEMWASFSMVALPQAACTTKRVKKKKHKICKAPQMTLQWTKPNGVAATAAKVKIGQTVVGGIAVNRGTPDTGIWTVVLRTNGQIVYQTNVTVG